MARIRSPFDAFMADFSAWMNDAWVLVIGILILITLMIVIASVTRMRAREKAKAPHYRRHESGEAEG